MQVLLYCERSKTAGLRRLLEAGGATVFTNTAKCVSAFYYITYMCRRKDILERISKIEINLRPMCYKSRPGYVSVGVWFCVQAFRGRAKTSVTCVRQQCVHRQQPLAQGLSEWNTSPISPHVCIYAVVYILQLSLEELVQSGVACLKPEYIAEYLSKVSE